MSNETIETYYFIALNSCSFRLLATKDCNFRLLNVVKHMSTRGQHRPDPALDPDQVQTALKTLVTRI